MLTQQRPPGEAMNRQVGIFGTSGMAVETADIAIDLGMVPILIAESEVARRRCRHDFDVILESELSSFHRLPCVIGIGSPVIRRRIAERFSASVRFINLVHPSASFGHGQRARVEQSCGVIICSGVRMTRDVKIGCHTIFNLNVTISHDSSVGDFSTLSPQACVLGNVIIGEGVWVGASATVNQGSPADPRHIGANVVIGSGAVVVANCDAGKVYVGVPAGLRK